MDRTAEAPMMTADVARLLDVSAERVRQLEREGRIQAIRTNGGFRLYDRASIEAYLKARE